MKRLLILLVVLFFVSSCTPADIGTEPEIVDFYIEPDDFKAGDTPFIYFKAVDVEGIDKLSVSYNKWEVDHDCNGEKVCEYVWDLSDFEVYVVGRLEVVFEVTDTAGNKVSDSLYKIISLDIDMPDLEERSIDHGSLDKQDDVWVLSLDGSSYEMGYAQGYLLGEQIKSLLLSVVYPRGYTTSSIETISGSYTISEKYEEEIQGMYDGMIDSGIEMYMDEVDQEFGIVHLRFMNVFNEIEPAVWDSGCTTVSVWDEMAEEGHAISARGLGWDVFDELGSAMFKYTLLIAREPDDGNEWVNLGYPGILGIVTAMNENGVVLSSNNIPDGIAEIDRDFPHDISLLLGRDLLEDESVVDPVIELRDLIDSKHPESARIITIGTPDGEGVTEVFGILEMDAADTVLRVASDNEDGDLNKLVAANSFLEYKSISYSSRYKMVLEEIDAYTAGESVIGIGEMLDIYKSISDNTDAPAQQHIMIANLDERSFNVYLAGVEDNNDFIPASYAEPHSFTWCDLFEC